MLIRLGRSGAVDLAILLCGSLEIVRTCQRNMLFVHVE